MKQTAHQLTDEELIIRAGKGDERAFTQLIKRYESLVHGFAFKVCRDRTKADETLQDTFINVFRKLDQFDGKSKFSTWLYSITANNCLMKRRKRKIDRGMESLDIPQMDEHESGAMHIQSWDETPVEKLLSAETRELLDAAIQKLPQEYRIVFVLRDMEELTAEETAKILKLSVPAVKSRLRRARIFLRQQLHPIMKSE